MAGHLNLFISSATAQSLVVSPSVAMLLAGGTYPGKRIGMVMNNIGHIGPKLESKSYRPSVRGYRVSGSFIWPYSLVGLSESFRKQRRVRRLGKVRTHF